MPKFSPHQDKALNAVAEWFKSKPGKRGGAPQIFRLFGYAGTGKTTLANIIAHTLNIPFFTLSAISSGVKDVREVIEKAKAMPERSSYCTNRGFCCGTTAQTCRHTC